MRNTRFLLPYRGISGIDNVDLYAKVLLSRFFHIFVSGPEQCESTITRKMGQKFTIMSP